MSQPMTTTQIRQNIVNEAITRATRECEFLFVYEYKGTLSDNTTWATLLEREQPPKDSVLLCTVNPNGVVEWKIEDPDLIQSQTQVEQTLPLDEVTFNNVTVTIAAADPATAYTLLCNALARFDFTTDTFHTYGPGDESEEQDTEVLFASNSEPAQHHAQLSTDVQDKQLLSFIVEFCSERLEWFCGECYRDSAEVIWLETARSLLGYPPLDFTGITFAQEPPSVERAQST